jgi:PII-like signaling protein
VANEDCIKLTSYLGERDRAGQRLTAGALMDLYSRRKLAGSILLRGMPGERALTAIAVGTRPAIEAVLDQALELTKHGLITLERAQLFSDEIAPVGFANHPAETTRLCFFLGSHDRVYGTPAFEAICELLHRRGITGATVVPGIDGTAHGRRLRARFASRDAEAPVMITAVDSGDRIGFVLPELGNLVRRPLITLEEVRVCKRDGQFISNPENAEGTDDHGFRLRQKLTVYTSQAARYEGRPVHRAIVRELRSAAISGTTVHRGIWGFHGDQPPHGDHFLRAGRHMPAVTTVIGTADRISSAFGIIDKLTNERGLVTSQTVPAFGATSAH